MSTFITNKMGIQQIAPVEKSTAKIAASQAAGIQIAVIDLSDSVTETEARALTAALQIQVTRDFYPVWGINATFTYYTDKTKVPPNCWWIVLLDTPDVPGALGYHDLTPDNLPLSKVFVKLAKQYGYSWTVTASHEALEMLVDPYINLTAFVQTTNTRGTLYAYEVCDACEDDSYGYYIGTVKVSDFVYPTWFEDSPLKPGTKYDFRGKITAPFQLLPNGYISVFYIYNSSGWRAQYGSLSHGSKRGSRRSVMRAEPEVPFVISE